MKQLINSDTANNDDFKCFKHKAKLLGNTLADGGNWILKNATISGKNAIY